MVTFFCRMKFRMVRSLGGVVVATISPYGTLAVAEAVFRKGLLRVQIIGTSFMRWGARKFIGNDIVFAGVGGARKSRPGESY